MGAPGRVRLREQPVHGVHADPFGDGRREPGRRPGKRVRPRADPRRRQRPRRDARGRAANGGPRSERGRSVVGGGADVPPRWPFARGPRQVPTGRRGRRMGGPRSDPLAPRAIDCRRHRRDHTRRDRSRGRARRRRRHRGGAGGAAARPLDAPHRAVGGRRFRVAELTYREAVSRAIAQEMERDETVYFIGEDVEAWAMAIPGLKVVVPSNPTDMIGLFAAAVRDPDPVIVVEPKALYAMKADVPDGEIVDRLGAATVLREGSDVTICVLGSMVHRAMDAAERLAADGIGAEVIDVRSLVPLDTQAILASTTKTGRFVTVEESPRLCGWGAEGASIVAEEVFYDLDGPVVRITTPHIPLPSTDALEDLAIPSPDVIVERVKASMG